MAAPDMILELVERFNENSASYKQGKYNETQTRREFIDPFFKALGWDIDNASGKSELDKDVIHEDAIKVGDAVKAPDYCFRVGSARKFFVEAKKPSVAIKDDIHPAYQLRRYGWSAKLPLSVLTDFEEFAVYDCRIMPEKNDKAAHARLWYLTYADYAAKWDEIVNVFSREAILGGSFDAYAEAHKDKRGMLEVDVAFLREIERWRDLLARHLAERNPALTRRELNFAVQITIDRLIFLRICEDRGIEPYGRLQTLQEGDQVYDRLLKFFYQADARYDSGIFHFKSERAHDETPDTLTPHLKIDDDALKTILKTLYYPDSPYAFSVIPADILGQVYEQFLGKVITLNAAHQAVVEDKPEVKKAGGVYYTPTYIVEYIVKQTVGELLKQQALTGFRTLSGLKLTILDPACGSGSFLIGAYHYLLEWHRDRYLADDPEKWSRGKRPRLCRSGQNDWKLTIDERKRILLDHIYGLDIDSQAVEVTKLSLLLKALEGENEQSLASQMALFHERVLPNLSNNIKCGNSLIASDFYEGTQLGLLDEEELYRVNAFDWEKEFPEILRNGGFDAIIGNPPYVRQESLTYLKEYFQKHYQAYDGVADLYVYFIEKSLSLLQSGGLFSIIVSSSFLRANYGKPLRSLLSRAFATIRIIDFGGLAVFANAKDTYVCIPLIGKSAQPEKIEVCNVQNLEFLELMNYVSHCKYAISASRLGIDSWIFDGDAASCLFQKIMNSGIGLGDYVGDRFFRGVTTGLNEAFVIDTSTKDKLISQDAKSAEIIKPLLQGENIRSWEINYKERWLIFTRRGINIDNYPAIKTHLSQWEEDLTPKQSKEQKRGRKPGKYKWYEIQDEVAYYPIFESPKIIFPDITKEPRFYFDSGGHYLANTAYALGSDDLYLLGILNSKLFWFAISKISIPFGIRAGKYRYRLIYQYMKQVPIRPINFSELNDKAYHDKMVELVQRMLDLHTQLAAANIPQARTMLQRQIDATDQQIDRLVYELYGLTDDEIRIVEGGA